MNINKMIENYMKPRQQMLDSRNMFSDMLNRVISEGASVRDQPRLTAEDLFGDQIQMLGDRTGANANTTKRMLARSIMGGGGDITGAGASSLLQVDQNTNDQLGRQLLGFENLALGENRYQQSRGDQLLNLGLQGLQNLYGIDRGVVTDQVMQQQAKKQRQANMFGNVLQAGVTAAVLLCWVAVELYGENSNEYHSIRALLVEEEKQGGELAEFVEKYREEGEQWAKELRHDPDKRRKAKVLFDHLYELSKAA